MGNKLAVITGAANGLGLALAKACIQDQMNVVMTDVSLDSLQEQVALLQASTSLEVIGIPCDVSKEHEVHELAKHVFERFQRVDLLINNAGITGPLAPIWEVPSTEIRHVLDVNLYGVLHGIQAFLPLLFQQSHPSHIVNIASFYGLCSGSEMAAYAMSKHAIVALSESLYFDLQRVDTPVTLSVVCPSLINTELLLHSAPKNDTARHQRLGQLMTYGRPAEDVAECILRGVKNNTFYILPDNDIKPDCEQHMRAIIEEEAPYKHALERLFCALHSKKS